MNSCRKLFNRNLARNSKRACHKPLTFSQSPPTFSQSRAMAFFPRNFYETPESSFTPLFRLLDDFDNYARKGGSQQTGRRMGMPVWQPKFDLRETSDSYELHGELPGIGKDQVQIEFSDPQTMHVRGRVERSYSAGTPPAGHLEEIQISGTITQGEEPKNGHQATVEDEKDTSPNKGVVAKVDQKKATDNAKYWLTERSIGEFSRSFNFPGRIDQDAISANFKDGILSIVLPKVKKHESRRIVIN
uniref:HSP28.7 n=1 Tax=Nilaparvata lugens TaxID=108931 RepID=A0A6C0VBC2_NILLU|nr:HSP28.7 [Nilaparvata lugens]